MREMWLKLRLFYLKRSVPRCYLFSSKFMLAAACILAVYFLFMDIKLIVRVKHRAPLKPFLQPTSSKDTVLPSSNETNTLLRLLSSSSSSTSPNFASTTTSTRTDSGAANTIGVFWPLPVKKIMMAEGTHFIRSPLAEFVEHFLGFSYLFPFIGPNAISLTHCALSIVCIRFLVSDSLFWRQVGVCIFQFRNFLDSFDGVVYRAHANRHSYKSHYGSIGYYVDAFSDVFGGTCLIGSIAIYLLKHPPPNKSLTRCFRLAVADDLDDTISSIVPGGVKVPILPTANIMSSLSSSTTDYHDDKLYLNNRYVSSKVPRISEGMLASKAAILTSVAFLGIRFALSALFWDRSVHAYEDLLDCQATSELHQVNINFFC